MHESEKSKLSRSVVSIATPWTAAHHCKYASPNLENVYFSSLFYRGLGKEDGDGTGNPHQYSCLETPMDGGAWWAAVHGFAKSQTGLSDFTFTFHFHVLEKEIVTHSSALAWRIPGMGEPGGCPSMGTHRVEHDWRDLAAAGKEEDVFGLKIQMRGLFFTCLLFSC